MKLLHSYKRGLLFLILFSCSQLQSQELYVFSEPASTMPAKSIILKQTYLKMEGIAKANWNTEVELSPRKNWMIHLGTNYSSSDLYLQHRFYSFDQVHKHTRLAWYAKAISAGSNPRTDAILLDGQQKLWGAGWIATRLQHKWASSISMGYLYRYAGNTGYGNQAIQYSLSNGWLIYPKSYSNYNQTNFNFYTEILGQNRIDGKGDYIDIAPAIQLIFHSQAKFNVGYRFPLVDHFTARPGVRSWFISYDYLFFNALSKSKKPKIN